MRVLWEGAGFLSVLTSFAVRVAYAPGGGPFLRVGRSRTASAIAPRLLGLCRGSGLCRGREAQAHPVQKPNAGRRIAAVFSPPACGYYEKVRVFSRGSYFSLCRTRPLVPILGNPIQQISFGDPLFNVSIIELPGHSRRRPLISSSSVHEPGPVKGRRDNEID